MGVLENIQDYFIKNSTEYKNFINKMLNTSPEIFYMDGERKFSNIEKNYFKIFNKDEAKKTLEYSHELRNSLKNNNDMKQNLVEESQRVKVIPATPDQIKAMNEEFYDPFKIFSVEQLNSVPDVIESNILEKSDKIHLLLNNHPDLFENGTHFTYNIDQDNYLKKHIIKDDYDPQVRNIYEFVSKENVFFDIKVLQLDESLKVEVIPASEDQKRQYSKHSDGEQYSDLPSVDFPSFSEDQLKSIPDVIQGIPITDHEKKMILLNAHETTTSTNLILSIDPNNRLVGTYLEVDQNMEPYEVKKFISKADVLYKEDTKELKEQLPMLNVYQVNTDGQVYFKTSQKNLDVGDKINLLTKDGDLYCKGEVTHIHKGEIQLNTDTGIVRAPFDARIEALFLNDSQNQKVNVKYGVDETITLLDISLDQKKIDIHENYFSVGNRMQDFTELLKGNKTAVLPFEKEKAEGKLQIVESLDGKPFVSIDLKNPKLNIVSTGIEHGRHHFKLDQGQIEKLKKTGELGLVKLRSSITLKESKLWVSVDKELNKVVCQKEDAIKINNIFGTATTAEQKEKLRSGEGILLDIKGANYFVLASAASKNSDGLRHFTESKAREFQLIPSKILEQSKDKSKGMKL